MLPRILIRRLSTALLFCALAVSARGADLFCGKVTAVTDGDTVQVLANKTPKKIRLYGVDAPERKQDFGTRAKQFTSDLCFGKNVCVSVNATDRYGRIVGEVKLDDGRSVNQELVRAGYAWWYRAYAKKDAALEKLEEEARRAKRGLWSQPEPVSPWKYRRDAANARAAAKARSR